MFLDLVDTPWLGLILTAGAYLVALLISRLLGGRAWANPVLWASAAIIGFLQLTKVDYAHYMVGGALFSPFLGLAVVALAALPFRHRRLLRKSWIAIIVAVGCGSLAGLFATVTLAWGFGASELLILSLAPKQATSPVALTVALSVGGSGELAAVLAVVTGILGATFGLPLLNLLGVINKPERGLAMGVSAHAIGTAHLGSLEPDAAAFSAVGMVLAALFVTIFVPTLFGLLALL